MKSPKTIRLMYISLCFFFITFQSLAQNSPTSTKATYPSPHVQWLFKTEGQVQSTPLIVGETIYFGSGDGNCYAASLKTGKEKWRFSTKGVVVSSPVIASNLVYFSSRDQNLYALDATNGKKVWSFPLGKELAYPWAFDNQTSSPLVVESNLYVGSGDGQVYAVDPKTGKEKWHFKTKGLVRASPTVANNVVYIGDTEGYFYALNANTGKQVWRFETEGVHFNPAEFGFDRKAIMFAATLTDELAVFGGRDGFLYAVERATGKERWRMDHKVSWVMSKPAIADGKAFTGTSDGRFVQAVDLKTGQEIWKFTLQSVCWSSPTVADGVVYIGSDERRLYALNTATGEKEWQFRTGGQVRSTPVVKDGVIYFGSHDGYLYALTNQATATATYTPAKKVVYWDQKENAQGTFLDVALFVRDFLVQEGYEIIGDSTIVDFVQQRIQDRQPSVIVFPSQMFPAGLLNDSTEAAYLRQYLNAGGKVAYLNAPPPFAYARDPNTQEVTGLQFSKMSKVLGIPYLGDNSFTFGGFYRASVTPAGTQMGLRGWWVNSCSVDVDQVTTVLALDERGKASAWVKNYGGRPGTGLVQLPPLSYCLANSAAVLSVIEYGL